MRVISRLIRLFPRMVCDDEGAHAPKRAKEAFGIRVDYAVMKHLRLEDLVLRFTLEVLLLACNID